MKKFLLFSIGVLLTGFLSQAQPYIVFYTSSGNWEDVTWEYDTNGDTIPDTPANPGAYPLFNGSDTMSDGTAISQVRGLNLDDTITIDALTLPEAKDGNLNVVFWPTNLVMKNFGGTSFTFLGFYPVADVINTEDPATPLQVNSYVPKAAGTKFETGGDFIVIQNCQLDTGTYIIGGDLIASAGNAVGIMPGASLTVGGNAILYRPNIDYTGELHISGNLTLDGDFANMIVGTDAGDPATGPAICEVGGNFLLADTQSAISVDVNENGALTVGGYMDMRGLEIERGGNVNVTGNLNLKYGVCFIWLRYFPDNAYGNNSLTVDSLIVSTSSVAAIEIGAFGTLEANHIVTPDLVQVEQEGTLTLTNDLRLLSDAGKSGSFINKGTFSGTINYERYMATDGTQWHLVSSPVVGQDFWSFATETNNAVAEKEGRRALTTYNEGIDGWDAYPTSDPSGNLEPGVGYSMLRSSDGVVTFSGSLNSSDVTVSIDSINNGWNLMGNPYPSSINATETADSTNNLITANLGALSANYAALYLWHAASGQYVTLNNAGTGSIVEDYIQAGQGFFVKSKSGGGAFNITKAMRSHKTGVSLKSGKKTWPTINLVAESGELNSSTAITFNDEMTTGLDVSYDAGMFKANKDFALYSRMVDDNGVDLAIQALPQRYDELVIPVGIDVPVGTEVTFHAQTVGLPGYAAVWFEDRQNGTFTRLDQTDAAYTTIIGENTTGVGNFFIHTNYSVTAADFNETNDAYRVLVNRNEGYLRISTSESEAGQAKLYDMAGRLHSVLDLQQGNENKMYINTRAGIYVLQVVGGKETFSEKVVWK